MIHENKIELYPVNKLYRFHSTFGLGDLQPVGLQEGSCDFSVDQIVVHHQHLIIFGRKRLQRLLRLDLPLRHFRQGSLVRDLLYDLHRKCGTLTIHALYADRTLHQFGQSPCNGKAKPRSFRAPVPLRIELLEILKDPLKVFFADPAAGILHLENQTLRPLLFSRPARNENLNLPFPGKFQRIVQQVHQNLLDPALIPHIAAGNRHIVLALHHQSML